MESLGRRSLYCDIEHNLFQIARNNVYNLNAICMNCHSACKHTFVVTGVSEGAVECCTCLTGAALLLYWTICLRTEHIKQ